MKNKVLIQPYTFMIYRFILLFVECVCLAFCVAMSMRRSLTRKKKPSASKNGKV